MGLGTCAGSLKMGEFGGEAARRGSLLPTGLHGLPMLAVPLPTAALPIPAPAPPGAPIFTAPRSESFSLSSLPLPKTSSALPQLPGPPVYSLPAPKPRISLFGPW